MVSANDKRELVSNVQAFYTTVFKINSSFGAIISNGQSLQRLAKHRNGLDTFNAELDSVVSWLEELDKVRCYVSGCTDPNFELMFLRSMTEIPRLDVAREGGRWRRSDGPGR